MGKAAKISIFSFQEISDIHVGYRDPCKSKKAGPANGDSMYDGSSFWRIEYGTGSTRNGEREACMVLESWFRARQESVGKDFRSETNALVWEDADV